MTQPCESHLSKGEPFAPMCLSGAVDLGRSVLLAEFHQGDRRSVSNLCYLAETCVASLAVGSEHSLLAQIVYLVRARAELMHQKHLRVPGTQS